MKNKIEDLRNHLFETIEALKDSDKPMPLDRAKAIADVAQVIINSAKVEVDFMRAVDASKGTGFIPQDEHVPQRPRLIKGRSASGSD
jgi:hypothetical protein